MFNVYYRTIISSLMHSSIWDYAMDFHSILKHSSLILLDSTDKTSLIIIINVYNFDFISPSVIFIMEWCRCWETSIFNSERWRAQNLFEDNDTSLAVPSLYMRFVRAYHSLGTGWLIHISVHSWNIRQMCCGEVKPSEKNTKVSLIEYKIYTHLGPRFYQMERFLIESILG